MKRFYACQACDLCGRYDETSLCKYYRSRIGLAARPVARATESCNDDSDFWRISFGIPARIPSGYTCSLKFSSVERFKVPVQRQIIRTDVFWHVTVDVWRITPPDRTNSRLIAAEARHWRPVDPIDEIFQRAFSLSISLSVSLSLNF